MGIRLVESAGDGRRFVTMHHAKIIIGDVRDALRTLPDESVQTVVTSPPYWSLRDYGHAGQLGLEPTADEYVSNLVDVFRDVRRVLRCDGTLWLNLGDSYARNDRSGGGPGKQLTNAGSRFVAEKPRPDVSPKNLLGMPWRVAFALQDDGWNLRSDVIWNKPNAMPESCTDRPTKAHEYVFLLTRSERYYYDHVAIMEDATGRDPGNHEHKIWANGTGEVLGRRSDPHGGLKNVGPVEKRNRRSVWTIPTGTFPGAHFATFPRELVDPCVLAGTSEKGCCATCGAPRLRIVERTTATPGQSPGYLLATGMRNDGERGGGFVDHTIRTANWQPTCECNAESIPCTVLDPFGGSGTTADVALARGRNAILCELNPRYAHMAADRVRDANPMFNRVEIDCLNENAT